MRLALLLMALSSTALAWSPVPEATPGQWVDLVQAVRERCEATRYSSNACQVAPADLQQPIRLALGIVATNYQDELGALFGDPPWGPVVCETNVSGGSTNIWCWTNHVALDSDFVFWTNTGARLPFGPQVTTNLIWSNTDSRLAPFDLPAAWTAQPAPALINQLDSYIKTVATCYVDTVAIQLAGGVASYFSTSATNWYWVDTDGDDVNDRWEGLPSYPSNFPTYTLSNLWRYAGLEPYRYPYQVVTQAVTRYGWQTGQLTTYSIEEEQIVTNWVEQYSFTASPTATPWRVTLGQVWLLVTNTVTTIEINGPDVITRISDQFGAIPASGQVVPSNMVPRLLLGLESPTNRLYLVPPGTGALWQAIYTGSWAVAITGQAVDTGVVYRVTSNAETVTVDAFTWASSQTIAQVTSRTWLAASLSMPGFSYVEEHVYSNGVLIAAPTASVAGTSFELAAEGTSFEIGPVASLWRPTMRDWLERAAVVSNLQWLVNLPIQIAGEYDGWQKTSQTTANYNYYPQWLVCCQGDTTNADCTTDCSDVMLYSFPLLYAPIVRSITGATRLEWTYSGAGSYSERVYDGPGFLGTTKEASWSPELQWPDYITYRVSGYTTNLGGSVDYYTRLAGGDARRVVNYSTETTAWARIETMWPRSYTSSFTVSACDGETARLHVSTFAQDAVGPEQPYPRVLSTNELSPSGIQVTVDPAGVDPSPTWYATWSDSWNRTCEITAGGPTYESYSYTEQLPNRTERRMDAPSWLYRFRFQHLAE